MQLCVWGLEQDTGLRVNAAAWQLGAVFYGALRALYWQVRLPIRFAETVRSQEWGLLFGSFSIATLLT